MANLTEVAIGLIALLRQKAIGFETLIEVAQKLSAQGFTRVDIMKFYYGIMQNHANDLDESQLDMFGDINIHLSGHQCPIDQIIRLSGDPKDPIELYELVRQQTKEWSPPT